MQHVPGQRVPGDRRRPAVSPVAEERVPRLGTLRTDLMESTGLRPQLQTRGPLVRRQHAIRGQGIPTSCRDTVHQISASSARQVRPIFADGSSWNAADQGLIDLLGLPVRKRPGHRFMCAGMDRENHNPAGVTVETLHHSEGGLAGGVAAFEEEMQGLVERPLEARMGRLGIDPRRLVDDQDERIDVQNVLGGQAEWPQGVTIDVRFDGSP